jgi:hypothetical protein
MVKVLVGKERWAILECAPLPEAIEFLLHEGQPDIVLTGRIVGDRV